ncbi:crosslink repair DNA glycosylase YcaQ family protein [Kribbella sp. NPDC051770]|uniref:winged helix-turn-helix domain-containing protein n=1 Tax=Kribbella sp. NPDC051770 TaxID=3155413 RepID=UPI00341E3419
MAIGPAVSVDAARRVALGAQGFGAARPARVGVRELRRAVERIGVLQLDSVNVLCRSHYLPLFSRLGDYSRERLDRMCWGGGELFEYFWGHKAALLPVASYPLVRWRMEVVSRQVWDQPLHPELQVPWSVVVGMRRLEVERPGLVDEVLAMVAAEGPITAGEADRDGVRRKRSDPDPDPSTGRMWNWQDAKIAIEYLFASGKVAIAGRRHFERLYDVAERVLPAAAVDVDDDEARRELVRIAARSLGVMTAGELCGATKGHYPLPAATARRVVGELVDAGDLVPVQVDGVKQQSYLWRDAEDRPIDARALLSPFDTLIWNRDRTERLFGFRYRISIYTPEPQRIHGYYVLPFLLGDQLVARVDLKADRRNATLVVPTLTADATEVVEPLAAELQLMARWLELDRVEVTARGAFGRKLARVVN